MTREHYDHKCDLNADQLQHHINQTFEKTK